MERKITQGRLKFIQRFNDLIKNKDFQSKIANARLLPQTKQNTAWKKIAIEYSLSYEIGAPFLDYILHGKINQERLRGDWYYTDMCICQDVLDDIDDIFPDPGKEMKAYLSIKKVEFQNFPIRIGISPLASQADVVDYIKKNWDEINDRLGMYRDTESPPRIRLRKNIDRDNFIWENRKKPAIKIAELVNKKFDQIIDHGEVLKIKSLEKKRRAEK